MISSGILESLDMASPQNSQQKATTGNGVIPAKTGKAPTLADVARQAGVSKAAASVVLHNSKSQVRVSQPTRERLLAAAKELQYQPNTLARALFRKQTGIIGFYSDQGHLFDPLYPFFGTILKGLFQGCEEHEKNFLVHGVFHKRSEEDIFLELLNGQIDGLVLYTRNRGTPLLNKLFESRLPVVTVAHEVPGLPYVTVDAAQGGRLLARYLGEKGYHHVMLRHPPEVSPTVQERLDGFKAEAQQHGITLTSLLTHDVEPGEEERAMLLSPARRPQVVAAFSDYSADALAAFCLQHGLRVPQDLAITGFDNFLPTTRPAMRLTTIQTHYDRVARTAVSLLVAQINGEEVPCVTKLPVTLVPGDSA